MELILTRSKKWQSDTYTHDFTSQSVALGGTGLYHSLIVSTCNGFQKKCHHGHCHDHGHNRRDGHHDHHRGDQHDHHGYYYDHRWLTITMMVMATTTLVIASMMTMVIDNKIIIMTTIDKRSTTSLSTTWGCIASS